MLLASNLTVVVSDIAIFICAHTARICQQYSKKMFYHSLEYICFNDPRKHRILDILKAKDYQFLLTVVLNSLLALPFKLKDGIARMVFYTVYKKVFKHIFYC